MSATEIAFSNVSLSIKMEWQKVSKIIWTDSLITEGFKDIWEIKEGPSFDPFLMAVTKLSGTENLSQKKILQAIAKKVDYIPNGTQNKFMELLDIDKEALLEAFKKFKTDNPCTVKQEFQFKLLSGIIHANAAYRRMKRKESAKCTFCPEERQDFVHLFISCPKVITFRNEIEKNWPGEKMTSERWFLGVNSSSDILEKSKNILAKEINHFIFKRNWANEALCPIAFKAWLMSDEEPEEALASRVNKVFDHHLKWSTITSLLK